MSSPVLIDAVTNAVSTAFLVLSSESGQRWPYVSNVSTAEACPSLAWTVFTDSPA
jgi:hypothetical protein